MKGKTIKEALRVEPENLTEALHGLPPENVHCSLLAVTSMRLSITDFLADSDIDPKSNEVNLEDIINTRTIK